MKVLLIDIDSTIPNLALKKIEKYYIDKGDTVTWNNSLDRLISDKIYVSCIFPENKNKCRDWEGSAEIGGTGYDIKKKLPEEIEMVKPKINWGFTTRGCIRVSVGSYDPFNPRSNQDRGRRTLQPDPARDRPESADRPRESHDGRTSPEQVT